MPNSLFVSVLNERRDGFDTYEVSGGDLLRLLENCVRDHKPTEVPGGSGIERDPYRLSTPEQWRAVAASGAYDTFLILGGRMIRRWQNGFIADLGLHQVDPRTAWGKQEGPPYAEFARGVIDVMAGDGIQDQEVARLMRRLASGGPPPLPPRQATGRASAWQVLPALTAVLFLGEVARNPRAFPINLMILDLVESSGWYGYLKPFRWPSILWHPENLTPESNFDQSAPEKPQTIRTRSGGIQTVAAVKDLHGVGGKLPMSHTNAVKESGQAIPKVKKGLATPFNEEHKKEVSVLIHWLAQLPYLWTRYAFSTNNPIWVGSEKVLNPTHAKFKKGEESLQRELIALEAAIRRRIQVFDRML